MWGARYVGAGGAASGRERSGLSRTWSGVGCVSLWGGEGRAGPRARGAGPEGGERLGVVILDPAGGVLGLGGTVRGSAARQQLGHGAPVKARAGRSPARSRERCGGVGRGESGVDWSRETVRGGGALGLRRGEGERYTEAREGAAPRLRPSRGGRGSRGGAGSAGACSPGLGTWASWGFAWDLQDLEVGFYPDSFLVP